MRADIASVGGFFCGLNLAVLMISSFTAEAAKKGVDGKKGGPYKPPLCRRGYGFRTQNPVRENN